MLRVQGLSKVLRRTRAVVDFDLEIRDGDVDA